VQPSGTFRIIGVVVDANSEMPFDVLGSVTALRLSLRRHRVTFASPQEIS
jgi:hypothetical protein